MEALLKNNAIDVPNALVEMEIQRLNAVGSSGHGANAAAPR